MWTQIQDALRQSVSRVLTTFAAFLPSLAAMLLAVLIAALAATAFRWALTRVLRGISFDERLDRWGFSMPVVGSGPNAADLFREKGARGGSNPCIF